MSVAQQFLKELKEGNTVAAIEAIKEGLRQNAYQKIEETRQEILESYGFVLSEASFKKGDKVEIAHIDPNTSEPSFKGDTSVGEIVDMKNGKALVYDASEDEAEWTELSHIRKLGR